MYIGNKALQDPNSEISDQGATINHDSLEKVGNRPERIGNMRDLLDHPDLFKNYPELKSLNVIACRTNNDSELVEASFSPNKYQVSVVIPASVNGVTDRDVIRKHIAESVIHELQHAVQQIEGWPNGSQPIFWNKAAFGEYKKSQEYKENLSDPGFKQAVDSYEAVFINNKPKSIPGPLDGDQLDVLRDKISQQVQKIAHNLYLDDPGEVQARNTAAKYLSQAPEPERTRNVRNLPDAPSAKPSISDRICNAKFAVARKIEQIKEFVSPSPSMNRQLTGRAEAISPGETVSLRDAVNTHKSTVRIIPDAKKIEFEKTETRTTGVILSVSDRETVQLHGREQIKHRTQDLLSKPEVGQTVTIQYKNGKGTVTDRTPGKNQQHEKHLSNRR